jgi:MoxR-like ATPase
MFEHESAVIQQHIQEQSTFLQQLRGALSSAVIGQDLLAEGLLVALLGRGHVLLEGLPGLAKTLAAKTLASALDGKFSRIQFTPDLLPADVLGALVYNPARHEFSVRKGPIFSNFVLADEINRAPAKVQSALLEAMQEGQVTIGDDTFRLEEPFMVLATQNPIEQEGVYPLPEAQTDRFMLKILVDYPSPEEEQRIIRRHLQGFEESAQAPVAGMKALLSARRVVNQIYVDPKIETYILNLIIATRNPTDAGLPALQKLLDFGASPRGGIQLAFAARARAFLQQRHYVLPEDIIALCPAVLRHRIGLSFEAEADQVKPDDIIGAILKAVPVP